jgi:2-succinyl-6-hydroxy-2,4-cyclohexadiene-1-carboxylate synthase
VAPPQPQRVVLVHGFTQTGASWESIARVLRADGYDVATPTLPGHGGVPAADLVTTAATLATDHGPATWVGYSMGGRACLHVALTHPSAVERLVLLGATAGIGDPAERNARRHRDELLATRIEAIGVERFVDEWLAQPMFERVPPDAGGGADARKRDNTADGLAGALRLAGTGAQEPLWDRVHEIGVLGIPTLVLAGELDGKFKVLAKRLADAIGPSAHTEWVPGAGHAAHLEQPDGFVTIGRRFLQRPLRQP